MSSAKQQQQRVSWTPEEDRSLLELIRTHGPRNWSQIAEGLEGRVGKQCRERWRNHLDPGIRRDPFSPKEDELILKLVNDFGTRWSKIAERLPGRTENTVKNRYYCNLKQRDPDAPKRRPVKKGRTSQSESWWGMGMGAGMSDVDQWAMWLDAHADDMEDDLDSGPGSELGPEKLGNLVVNGLDEEQRKQANHIIDAVFSLVPPNFVSPSTLEAMATSRAPMLEAAITYIEAAQDHLRKLGGSEDLLPSLKPPGVRGHMVDTHLVDHTALYWASRGMHPGQADKEGMHMPDASEAQDHNNAAAMAAAMAAAYATASHPHPQPIR